MSHHALSIIEVGSLVDRIYDDVLGGAPLEKPIDLIRSKLSAACAILTIEGRSQASERVMVVSGEATTPGMRCAARPPVASGAYGLPIPCCRNGSRIRITSRPRMRASKKSITSGCFGRAAQRHSPKTTPAFARCCFRTCVARWSFPRALTRAKQSGGFTPA